MRQAIDILIPLLAAPLAGAGIGWLIGSWLGEPALGTAIGAFAGLGALLVVGHFLPEEDT